MVGDFDVMRMAAATAMESREARMKSVGLQDVSWYNTSPYRQDAASVEIGLRTTCGAVLRFRLPTADARHLYETLNEALHGPGDQSSRSSGTCIDDARTEGEKVSSFAIA